MMLRDSEYLYVCISYNFTLLAFFLGGYCLCYTMRVRRTRDEGTDGVNCGELPCPMSSWVDSYYVIE